MSTPCLQKVTVFISRPKPGQPEQRQLLLFKHPYARVQFIAGTVDPGETPEVTALREAGEEAGLAGWGDPTLLAQRAEPLPAGWAVLIQDTSAYSRPDPASFNWVSLPRGPWVEVLRQADGYSQVHIEEPDQHPEPNYASLSITAWVPDAALVYCAERFFYHLEYRGAPTPPTWPVAIDNHIYQLFWADFGSLPEIHPFQAPWLEHLRRLYPEI